MAPAQAAVTPGSETPPKHHSQGWARGWSHSGASSEPAVLGLALASCCPREPRPAGPGKSLLPCQGKRLRLPACGVRRGTLFSSQQLPGQCPRLPGPGLLINSWLPQVLALPAWTLGAGVMDVGAGLEDEPLMSFMDRPGPLPTARDGEQLGGIWGGSVQPQFPCGYAMQVL